MSKASLVVSALTRRLDGKVALITGGASGIGAYTAKLFTKHGAKVAIVDIQDDLGRSIVHSIDDPLKNHITYIHCDVRDEQHIKNAVDETASTFGKLDIMFNNAGITDDPKPRVSQYEKSDFERVWNTNVTGVFLGMKHAARVMVPKRSGVIISTASAVTGLGGVATHAYTCSKHAVVGLTKNLAVELGRHGIRVNCLSPGAVPTAMSRGFFGPDDQVCYDWNGANASLKGVSLRVADVGDAALYLASDEAKFVSGINLFVDGGFSIFSSSAAMFN